MKLIALNLPRDFEQQDLEVMFKNFGTVTACNLVLDEETGASKGFGFAEMEQEEDALDAIRKLHGTKVKGRKIRVKPSTATATETETETET